MSQVFFVCQFFFSYFNRLNLNTCVDENKSCAVFINRGRLLEIQVLQ